MIIKKVENEEEANCCDNLLTKLLRDEQKYNDNIQENYVIKDYFKNVYKKDNIALIIVKENEEIIAYEFVKLISLGEGPDKYKEALIDGIYVEEEYRKQGIATKLIEEAKKWCYENDVKYISLHVIDKNIIAKKLYNKLGFETFYIDYRYELQ